MHEANVLSKKEEVIHHIDIARQWIWINGIKKINSWYIYTKFVFFCSICSLSTQFSNLPVTHMSHLTTNTFSCLAGKHLPQLGCTHIDTSTRKCARASYTHEWSEAPTSGTFTVTIKNLAKTVKYNGIYSTIADNVVRSCLLQNYVTSLLYAVLVTNTITYSYRLSKNSTNTEMTHMSANRSCTELVLMWMAAIKIGALKTLVYYNPHTDTRTQIPAAMWMQPYSGLDSIPKVNHLKLLAIFCCIM